MNTNNIIARINKLLTPVFFLIVAVFLVNYLRHADFKNLQSINIQWQYVLLASVIGLATRYWSAYIWLVLLKALGTEKINDKMQLLHVYSKAWLGRYIPGPATWMIGKIYFAAKHGVSKNKLAVSSLLEGALQIEVTLGLSILMLMFDTRLDVISSRFKLFMIIVFIGCIVAMTPLVFNKLVSAAYKLLKRKSMDRSNLASGKVILRGASLYAVGAILSGLSFFFIAKSIFPGISYHNLLFIMGISNLAGAVSMLAIAVPGGIGIREGVQFVLLSLIMPSEIALAITIFTRLWSIFVDLVFFAINQTQVLVRR